MAMDTVMHRIPRTATITTPMHTATATTTTAMSTDTALLRLIWLASPALPVGGFSYSEGLEAAVDAGLVHDEASASHWLVEQLHLSVSRGDLAVVAAAVPAFRRGDGERIAQLDSWVLHTRESSELRQQTEQMGRSLGDWQQSLAPGTARPPVLSYPLAFARAASECDASARDIALAFAFGWAENMTQAAIKAVPLGQGAGQRILHALAAHIPQAVDTALSLDDTQRQAFAPMLAILSARHETQYSRLFRS